MHMLTKLQVFYDDTHKQALGYQNPFHLKKAQRIKPTLYDGSVITKKHDVISVIDDEETLILEEESRSKMLDKQNDPISSKVNAPTVPKLDLEPLTLKLKNNREAHVDYIRITKENADTLRDIVEQARISNPLDNALAY
ncbi:hypothetical protein Tco_0593047 [Tanacetum coccineum]